MLACVNADDTKITKFTKHTKGEGDNAAVPRRSISDFCFLLRLVDQRARLDLVVPEVGDEDPVPLRVVADVRRRRDILVEECDRAGRRQRIRLMAQRYRNPIPDVA